MIRAVFLDIDNTLLDFDETVRESMREGFARLPGIAPEGTAVTCIVENLWEIRQILC